MNPVFGRKRRQPKTTPAVCRTPARPDSGRRGFSLIELVIVLSVTLLLISIMLPALYGLRAHTERVLSASNQRQVGMGMAMYSADFSNRLPYSALIHVENPEPLMQEMMATYLGPQEVRDGLYVAHADGTQLEGWEGVGLLFAHNYIPVPDVFYAPSHRGDHPLERYRAEYDSPDQWIYSNYHYRGDIDPFDDNRFITLDRDAHRVLLMDGMRTRRDLNHKGGFNSLLGDGSVFWRWDEQGALYNLLPEGVISGVEGKDIYRQAWEIADE